MKRASIVSGLFLLALACGSSSSGNGTPTFNYGTSQPANESQSLAASMFQSGLQSGFSINSDSSGQSGQALATLPSSIGALLFAGAGVPSALSASPSILDRVLAPPPRASFPGCVTVTSTSVTYTSCSETFTDGTTLTVNGSISWTSSTASWDVTETVSGTTTGGESLNLSFHGTGNFALTSTTLKGSAAWRVSGSVTSASQTANFDVTLGLNADLTFQKTPSFCITGGTAEVTLVWTTPPPTTNNPDRGVKFTWTGCDAFTVQVAHTP